MAEGFEFWHLGAATNLVHPTSLLDHGFGASFTARVCQVIFLGWTFLCSTKQHEARGLGLGAGIVQFLPQLGSCRDGARQASG